MHEADELCCQFVLILDNDQFRLGIRMQPKRTVMFGLPRENPVPTGCSTNKMLDRFVQLNSF